MKEVNQNLIDYVEQRGIGAAIEYSYGGSETRNFHRRSYFLGFANDEKTRAYVVGIDYDQTYSFGRPAGMVERIAPVILDIEDIRPRNGEPNLFVCLICF